MAFTRFNYDPCRTAKLLQESTGPGRYIFNTPGIRPCYLEDPHIRLQKWGGNLRHVPEGHPIDIDSDLIGITRPLTRDCINHEFPQKGTFYSEKKDYCTINAPFSKQSRTTHPAWMYLDLEQSRKQPLFLNPQESVSGKNRLPFYSYLNTRILEKDSFVPKIPCLNFLEKS